MSFTTVKEKLTQAVANALSQLQADGIITTPPPRIALVPPKQADHGDYACTVALALAKPERKNPRDIATALQEALGDAGGLLERTEIAGPGYLNLFVQPATWHQALADILTAGADFIRTEHGKGQKVLVEYVSANPTGPLHIAHGRGAVTGDIICRLLKLAGHEVTREYYVNDLGNQADVMARSVHLRYGELLGRPFTPPEDFYPGEYISEIAQSLVDEHGNAFLDAPEEQWLDIFRQRGIDTMLARIRADLAAFGVEFDHWVSERQLTQQADLPGFVRRLEADGHIYEQDGKKWFRTTEFGDDKDRVVVREDGRTTYFASDIAYHHDKLSRGHEHLINIWGADHGGYITRVKAGLSALGYAPNTLEVILVQMVSLSRGGQAVRMGKRLGTAVWLSEVVGEAGKDATRYFFALRSANSQMDFDLDLATSKTLDNPVYYAQMGHARMRSIARRAKDSGVPEPQLGPGALDALTLPEELNLIKSLLAAPEVVADSAQKREPHQVVHYIQDLIAQFHSYYTQYKNTERVISDDAGKTRARLLLCQGLQTTLKVLLEDALGVAAPEEMRLEEDETTAGED